MTDRVFIPDESGMGGEEVVLGEPHWDPDCQRWMVQLNQFVARPATREEAGKAEAAWQASRTGGDGDE